MVDFINDLAKLTQSLATPQPVSGGPTTGASPADINQIRDAALGSEQDRYSLDLARDRGNSRAVDNEILRDRSVMSPVDFELKYGSDVAGMLNAAERDREQVYLDRGTSRGMGEVVTDSLLGVGRGAVGAASGMAALGAGIFGAQAGKAVADAGEAVADGLGSLQSHRLNTMRDQDAVAAQLDAEDNRKAYREDLANGEGEFISGLRSIGRGVITGVNRLADNPTGLLDGTAEGVGSLLLGGPVSKGIAAGIRGAGAVLGAGASRGAQAAAAWGDKAAMPAAIAAMEAGGSYQDTLQEVLAMSYEDLAKNSPDFNTLIEQGYSQEEARNRIAQLAAYSAAAITAPAAAAAGKISAGFEAAPGAAKTVVGALRNMGEEAIEEGIQGGVSTAASNKGIQAFADNTRDLVEGVGDAIGQGAVLGMAAGGAVSGAGLTKNAVVDGVGAASTAIQERGDRIAAENAAKAPNSAANVSTKAAEVAAAVPDIVNNINSVATEVAAAPAPVVAEATDAPAMAETGPEESGFEQKTGDNDLASIGQRVEAAMIPQQEELMAMSTAAKGKLASLLGSAPLNRVAYTVALAQTALDTSLTAEDRAAAAMTIALQRTNNSKLFEQDLPSLIAQMDGADPRMQDFQDLLDLSNLTQEVPEIKKAMDFINKEMSIPEIDDTVDLSAPEGAQKAALVADAAAVVPDRVSEESKQNLLFQRDMGVVNLSDEQANAIRSSIALNQAAKAYDQAAEAVGLPAGAPVTAESSIVHRQLTVEGGNRSGQLSLLQHQTAVSSALRNGDVDSARVALYELSKFARHMRNKAAALMESADKGGAPVEWRGLGARREWMPADKPYKAQTHLRNANSVGFARNVYAEAQAAVALYNGMVDAFPVANVLPKVTLKAPSQAILPTKTEKIETIAPISEAELAELDAERQAKDKKYRPRKGTFLPSAEGSLVMGDNAADNGIVKNTKPKVKAEPKAKAPVEEVVEEAAVEEASKKKVPTLQTRTAVLTVADQFPELISSDNSPNLFKKGFRFAKGQINTLMRQYNPLDRLTDALSNKDALEDLLGENADKILLNKQSRDASAWMFDEARSVADLMNQALQEALKSEKGFLSLARSGKDFLAYRNYKVLNIAETFMSREGNRSMRFNPTLVEVASLASMTWATTTHENDYDVSSADVAELLGIPENSVTEEQMEFFENGRSTNDVVNSLTSAIMNAWGVSPNKAVARGQNLAVVEAVAKNLIKILEVKNILKVNLETFNERQYSRVTFNRDLAKYKAQAANMGAGALMVNAVLDTNLAFDGWTIGAPVQEVPTRQHRNAILPLSRQQRDAVKNAQNTPYHVDPVADRVLAGLTEDAFVDFMSAQKWDPALTNKQHSRTVDGQARTFRSSYRTVRNQLEAVRSASLAQGTDLGSVPTYYPWVINRLGRPQMGGAANPQRDKLARHVFMPTRSTLDLTDMDAPSAVNFYRAVAQGFGMKTENIPGAELVSGVRNMIAPEGALHDAFNAMVEHRKADLPGVPKAALDALKAQGLNSMHSLHAFASFAQIEADRADGKDMSKVTTSLYMEADGKTNGPIMAMVKFATGAFNGHWVSQVRRGGLFFGDSPRSLSSFYRGTAAKGSGLEKDLYGVSSETTSKFVSNLRQSLPEDIVRHMDKLFGIMAQMGMKISIQETDNGYELVIDRNEVKNPLTITIYGSGKDGIAGKVTDIFVRSVYAYMTDIAHQIKDNPTMQVGDSLKMSRDQFLYDLWDIMNMAVTMRSDKNGNSYNLVGNPVQRREGGMPVRSAEESIKNAVDFEMSKAQLKNLRATVDAVLVDPMVKAIHNDVMQHVAPATTAMQQAVQLKSIFLNTLFQNEVINAIANKKALGIFKDADFLSDKELEDITRNLLKQNPEILGSEQAFLPMAREKVIMEEAYTVERGGKNIKVALPEKGLSTALDDTLATQVVAPGMGLAGVTTVPMLTIGTGDGRMMTLLLSSPNRPDRVLAVFDGLNLAVDQISTGSLAVNSAVDTVWRTNDIAPVAKSFDDFLANKPMETLLREVKDEKLLDDFFLNASKAVQNVGQVKQASSIEDIEAFMATTRETLTRYAEEADIRAEVLSRVNHSTDQMAGGESPYHKADGVNIPDGASPDEVAMILNEVYGQVAAERAESKTKARTAEMKAYQDLRKTLFNVDNGYLDTNTGAAVVSTGWGFAAVVDAISDSFTREQQVMFSRSVLHLEDRGGRFVFGSPEEIAAHYQMENGKPLELRESVFPRGIYDPVSKTAYINMSAGLMGIQETILHETLHAATLDKMSVYYSRPSNLAVQDRVAVEHLENLMNEWLMLDFSAEGGDLQQNHAQMRGEIAHQLSADRKAEALNEFVAYMLGSQELAKRAAKMKVKNPIARLTEKVIAGLKRLVFGERIAPRVSDDIFSNVRFSVSVLMETPLALDALNQMEQVALYHSNAWGNNPRLTDLRARFFEATGQRVLQQSRNPAQAGNRFQRLRREQVNAAKVGQIFQAAFPMSNQEADTFRTIVAAFMANAVLDPVALSRAQRMYGHVLENIDVEAFRKNDDPNDYLDIQQATDKYQTLLGKRGMVFDQNNRSSLLASFSALAMTSDEFRAVLSKIKKPLPEKSGAESKVDRALEDFGQAAMDMLSGHLTGDSRKNETVRDVMDVLAQTLTEYTLDARSMIETEVGGRINAVEKEITKGIQAGIDKTRDALDNVAKKSSNKALTFGAELGKMIVGVLSEKHGTASASGAMRMVNDPRFSGVLRNLVTEIMGQTKENAPLFRRISLVRAKVDQVRQAFRENLPAELAKKFKTKPKLADKQALFRGVMKADLGALETGFNAEEILRMTTDRTERNRQVNRLENIIRAIEPAHANTILAKSMELAEFMMTGRSAPNLLTNADAIAHLLHNRTMAKKIGTADNLVAPIDMLTSLYAFEKMSRADKEAFASLARRESDAFSYYYGAVAGARREEGNKPHSPAAALNRIKGFVRMEGAPGLDLKLAPVSEEAQLIAMGYTKVKPYFGSSLDNVRTPMAYYFAPASSNNTYNQGVFQTVHESFHGVDPRNGFSNGAMTAGRITDPKVVARIALNMRNQKATEENLRPVFDEAGQLWAFERMVDPAMLTKLNQNQDGLMMVGAWRGRQMEEALSEMVNQGNVDALKKIWDKEGGQSRKDAFVALNKVSRKDDPVLWEAWRSIPENTKDYIDNIFNGDFMVRRDMLENAVGYRMPSVGDAWTGNTRWNERTQKEFQRIAMGIFGNNAYTWMTKGERVWQSMISDAKFMIVVLSGIVPAANLVSNMFQLMMNGVPMRHIASGSKAKLAEINEYIRRRDQEVKLDADLLVAQGRKDVFATRRIEARLQSIRDSYRRLSIWPLIENGEFSSISSSVISREDLALSQGRWTDLLNGLVEKLPEGTKDRLQTPMRYMLMAKDTPYVKAMVRATQYGDFIAKAILYDDLVHRQMKDPRTALDEINEEFVNYNALPGRWRSYTESMGMTWFWNYKLRIMKPALRTLRRYPLRALLLTGMAPDVPVLGPTGTSIGDNALSVMAEGRLDNSVGPWKIFGAPSLHPVINLLY